jgi:hypothetical protein
MDVMVSMKWQVMPGMGGNFEPELYIAFRSCPATVPAGLLKWQL